MKDTTRRLWERQNRHPGDRYATRTRVDWVEHPVTPGERSLPDVLRGDPVRRRAADRGDPVRQAVASAIANAIFAAAGVRLRALPLLPEGVPQRS